MEIILYTCSKMNKIINLCICGYYKTKTVEKMQLLI
jgi:hypothetical protein